MRVGVIGKGGAGKSVIAGTIARLAARGGARVIAFDSDPVPGLSLSLGSGPEPAEPLLLGATVQDQRGYWGWREGVDAVSAALRFSTLAPDGVRLLQSGKVAREGLGAIIGSSKAFVETARGVADAAELRDWTFIGDLPAGPRQLAENWAPYARTYLVVVQPSVQSALTARRVAQIARQAPAGRTLFIANRVRGADDVRHIEDWLREPVFASLPDDAELAGAERRGLAPIDHAPGSPAVAAMRRLVVALERRSA